MLVFDDDGSIQFPIPIQEGLERDDVIGSACQTMRRIHSYLALAVLNELESDRTPERLEQVGKFLVLVARRQHQGTMQK